MVTSSSYLAEGWDAPVCGITWGFTGIRGTWSTTAALTELPGEPSWSEWFACYRE